MFDAICALILPMDEDLMEVSSDELRTIFSTCATEDTSVAASVQDLDELPGGNGLGARLIERKNYWVYLNVGPNVVLMRVVNPYPVPLEGVAVRSYSGRCGSVNGLASRILFESPIPSFETRIAIFSFEEEFMTVGKDGCIDVIGAFPIIKSSRFLERVAPLVRAGEWHQAGLSLDMAEQLEPGSTDLVREDLHLLVRNAVRALPASPALPNRDGYDLLLALKSNDPDYLNRLARYQHASREERRNEILETAYDAFPFVTIDRVIPRLSEDKSRAQRDRAWAAIEGKRLDMRGRVTDVRPSGLISPTSIRLDIGGGNFGICDVEEFLSSAAEDLAIGETVTCSGELSSYTLLFGSLVVSVTGSEFSR